MSVQAHADHTDAGNPALQQQANGNNDVHHHDFEKATQGMSHEEKQTALHASRFGYGPLAHMRTQDSAGGSMLPGKISIEQSYRQHANLNSLRW